MAESPIIVALEAERIRLQRRLVELDDLERAARAYLGPAAPAPAPAKAATTQKPAATAKRRRAKRGELDMLLLEQLRDGAELSAPELGRRIGRTQATIEPVLQRLFGTGKVQHDDGTPRKWSRIRQRAPEPQTPAPAPAAPPRAPTAPLNGQREEVPPSDEVTVAYLERKLLAYLQKGPATVRGAAQAIDSDDDAVQAAVDRLLATGAVSQLEDGSYVG